MGRKTFQLLDISNYSYPRSGEFYTYGDLDFRLNDRSTLNILEAGFEKFDKNQNMILALLFISPSTARFLVTTKINFFLNEIILVSRKCFNNLTKLVVNLVEPSSKLLAIPQELIALTNLVSFDKLINLGKTSISRILKVEEIENGFGYILRFKMIGRHQCDVIVLYATIYEIEKY